MSSLLLLGVEFYTAGLLSYMGAGGACIILNFRLHRSYSNNLAVWLKHSWKTPGSILLSYPKSENEDTNIPTAIIFRGSQNSH